MMLSMNICLILFGLVMSCCGLAIRKAVSADNGLFGDFKHKRFDRHQGHDIKRRSYDFGVNADFEDEDVNDDGSETLINSETGYGYHTFPYHSFVPYGSRESGYNVPGYQFGYPNEHRRELEDNNWSNNFHGDGSQCQHSRGYHGGNSYNHKQEGNGYFYPKPPYEFGYGPGHHHGHNHGHHGHKPSTGGNTYPTQKPNINTSPPSTDISTDQIFTSMTTTPAPTTSPIYDIDVRLGTIN